MAAMRFVAALVSLAILVLPARAAPPLQPLIDATPTGGVLRPAAGVYAGPAVIDRSMTIDGAGQVTVDAGNRGTVLTVRTSGVTVRGLRLAGSGETHDGIDAGIAIEGDDNLIQDNTLENVLFGIHIKGGNRNLVRANRVVGKPLPLGGRGDVVRLWNGRGNRIENNRFERGRDVTITNSAGNRFAGNHFTDGRYGMQVIFSPRMEISNNRFENTGTGIVILYSPGVMVRGNRIAHAMGGGGGGIVFKESDDGLVEGNEVVHCAVGFKVDAPPEAVGLLTVRGNRFAHNIIGMYFYGEKGGHLIEGNSFDSNLTQVAISAPGAGAANVWRGNHWSDYEGFDRNGDGIGDQPHEVYLYADRIWMTTPKALFFANSPLFELIDFLERLAPFSFPTLVLRDSLPRVR